MKYLFDTDVLSNMVKPIPSTPLIAKLATVPRIEQCVSSITVGELIYGAARLGDRATILRQRIERLLLANLTIVSFDAHAARRYGELRAALEREGRPLVEADLRIAAIALSHNLILVTGNGWHFARISGLLIENWLI